MYYLYVSVCKYRVRLWVQKTQSALYQYIRMTTINMYFLKEHTLSVITIMALWELVDLGTPMYSCYKLILVMTGRACGVLVKWLSLLYKLHSINSEFRFCASSNPALIMSDIYNAKNAWKWSLLERRLNAFCRSTMPQEHIIVNIIAYLCVFTCRDLFLFTPPVNIGHLESRKTKLSVIMCLVDCYFVIYFCVFYISDFLH